MTGGQQSYTTIQPTEKLYSANTVYTTGPVQTTYEYVNVPGSTTYVDQQGQRWETSAPYGAERGTYEYVNYPEGYTTQQKWSLHFIQKIISFIKNIESLNKHSFLFLFRFVIFITFQFSFPFKKFIVNNFSFMIDNNSYRHLMWMWIAFLYFEKLLKSFNISNRQNLKVVIYGLYFKSIETDFSLVQLLYYYIYFSLFLEVTYVDCFCYD